MSQNRLRVSLVQFRVLYAQTYDSFLSRIKKELIKSKRVGAELIIFPELITYDLISRPRLSTGQAASEFQHIAKTVTQRFFNDVAVLAKDERLNILCGTSPILIRGRIFNRAMLVTDQGHRYYQDKIFLTPEERQFGWSGSKGGPKIFDLPWGRTAILICYDCEFPNHSLSLGRGAPEFIIVPAMTSDEHGRNRVLWTAQARAVEHYAFLAVAGIAGVPGDFFGQATLIGPQENSFRVGVNAGKNNRHGQILGTLDFKKLRRARPLAQIYPLRDLLSR